MTIQDLFTYAVIGAVTFDHKLESEQIQHLMRKWHSEWHTDVELVSFAPAFPEDDMRIADPDLPF